MKKQILLFLLFISIIAINLFAQTPGRTPQKIKEDNQGFEQFKKNQPELFLNKRLPIKLRDGNFFVKGYNSLGIRLTNTNLIDSVFHNFHLGKAEPEFIPYNSIMVTGPLASIDLFDLLVFSEGRKADSAAITLMDTSMLRNDTLDNKAFSRQTTSFSFVSSESGIISSDSVGIQSITTFDPIQIRVSLNGKLLFDWTPLISFPKNIFKSEHKWPPTKYGPFWIKAYSYGFHITDQPLAVNDQLLIEIKETKKGWMLDRFNITRVAVQPLISGFFSTDKKINDFSTATFQPVISEKKTLY